jgi:predicted GTPase
MTTLQFINKAADAERVAVGHRLRSCTAQIQTVFVTHPDNHHRVVFIDTPGFDDTWDDDTEILKRISDWLVRTWAFLCREAIFSPLPS